MGKKRINSASIKKKATNLIIKQVATYNQERIDKESFLQHQLEVSNEILRSLSNADEDIELGEKLKAIIKKRKKANDQIGERTYFSGQDIGDLGLNPNFIFVEGGKNIGKTYATAQEIKRIRKEDPKAKFMLLRNTEKEIKEGLTAQLRDGEEGPFEVTGNSYTLYQKSSWTDEEVTEEDGEKLVIKKRKSAGKTTNNLHGRNMNKLGGYASYVSGFGLAAKQGGSYKNLRLVYGDECNDTGEGHVMTDENLDKFLIFLLSMERNNRDRLKVILTGNLLRQRSGIARHILLDRFGIPHETKIKYGEQGQGDNKLKLLYINTGAAGELYDGVNTQLFINLFGKKAANDLLTNLPKPLSSKVATESTFVAGDPVFCFVFAFNSKRKRTKVNMILYLCKYTIKWTVNRISDYFIMDIKEFNPDGFHRGYEAVSDDSLITNEFGIVRCVSDLTIANRFQTIRNLVENRRVFFSTDGVRNLFKDEIYEVLKRRYEPILSEGY